MCHFVTVFDNILIFRNFQLLQYVMTITITITLCIYCQKKGLNLYINTSEIFDLYV